MGREIAQVMGPGGIEWLDAPSAKKRNTRKVLDSLDLRPGDVVATGCRLGLLHIPDSAKSWQNWQGASRRNSGGDAEYPASTCGGE